MARTWSAPEPPSFRLTEGTRLTAVWLNDGEFAVGEDGVESLTVQMEAGQGGVVPWARVRMSDGSVGLVNLAHVSKLEFADTLPADPGDEGGDE